jgi:PEP-CTERM motif
MPLPFFFPYVFFIDLYLTSNWILDLDTVLITTLNLGHVRPAKGELMRISVFAFTAAVLLSLCSTPALAADLILTNLALNGASTVYVNGQDVYLGQAYFTADVGGKTETFGAYCVDFYHDITLGGLDLPYAYSKLYTYSDGVLSGTGSLMNLSMAEEIGSLASYGLRSNDAITKDAVQALIWEDMGANLTGFGANGAAIQNEITYLQTLDLSSNIRPDAIYAANGLTQGFTTGVPEPSTWAMMLVGLLGLGAALRATRRDRRVTPLGLSNTQLF